MGRSFAKCLKQTLNHTYCIYSTILFIHCCGLAVSGVSSNLSSASVTDGYEPGMMDGSPEFMDEQGAMYNGSNPDFMMQQAGYPPGAPPPG